MHSTSWTNQRSLRLLLIGAAVLAACAAGAAPAALDGWRGYKFNMTPDQARAVPGMQWRTMSSIMIFGTTASSMSATAPIAQFDRKFGATLKFDNAQVLDGIDLANHETQGSLGQCQKSYETLLRAVEKNYGAFSPVNKPQAMTGDKFGSKSISWLRLAGAASQYEIDKNLSGGGVFYTTEAAVTLHGGSVDVNMEGGGDGKPSGFDCAFTVTIKRG